MSEFLLLLYLIEILHQTTTSGLHCLFHNRLYLIEILHQTTTNRVINILAAGLYLIEILHQTTTPPTTSTKEDGLYLIEILHQTTTGRRIRVFVSPLYLIEILHQTTTKPSFSMMGLRLYLIEILHQTTTISRPTSTTWCCILSKFYIKPQHSLRSIAILLVVSYRNSTSNHNTSILRSVSIIVVSYRNSTSNHNNARRQWRFQQLYLIEILHQTTTQSTIDRNTAGCILSKFYIKPQRRQSL